MGKLTLIVCALCVGTVSALAQLAPPAPAYHPTPPVDEHDQLVRMTGVANNIAKRLQQTEGESFSCSGDLASEQAKFSNDEGKIQALQAELDKVKAELAALKAGPPTK